MSSTRPQAPAPKTDPVAHGEPVLWELLGDRKHLHSIDDYEKAGGYTQLRKAIKLESNDLIEEIKTSGIRGRGGAGFPTGLKLSFIPKDSDKPKYVVCNADESEPCTFKDRELIERLPHLLVEGCLIAARAIGANYAFIYIRGEYYEPALVLMEAVDQARAKGLVGKNIDGSGWDCEVIVHRGAGAYICGEETALLSSLNGRRGQPTVKPPFPAVSGLYDSPTLLNNVETLATLPRILELGGEKYASKGVPKTGTGTRLFSLSGNITKPGNYELSIGASMRTLIEELGGGIPDGRKLKAIIPGGSSTPVLTPEHLDITLDYDAMASAGTMFGSGSVVVVDDRTCMAQLGLRLAQFYSHESCGKCTPCREGTKWATDIALRIVKQECEAGDVDLLYSVCEGIMGKCLCPLGEAMAMPLMSYIEKYREDFDRYLDPNFVPPTDTPVADIAERAIEASGVTKPGVTWAGALPRSSFKAFGATPTKSSSFKPLGSGALGGSES